MGRYRKNSLHFKENPKMKVFLQNTAIFGASIQIGQVTRIETLDKDAYKIEVVVRGAIELADLAGMADQPPRRRAATT